MSKHQLGSPHPKKRYISRFTIEMANARMTGRMGSWLERELLRRLIAPLPAPPKGD